MKRLHGMRKLAFGGAGLAFLLGGLVLCLHAPEVGPPLFQAYATAVLATVTAVVAGNVGEHVADRKRGEP